MVKGRSTNKIYMKLLNMANVSLLFSLAYNLTEKKSRGPANTGLIIPISLRDKALKSFSRCKHSPGSR